MDQPQEEASHALSESLCAKLETVERSAAQSNLAPLKPGFIGAVAALSGVLFGFDASIAASVGGSVNSHFSLGGSPFLQGLWVAAVPLGALIGALCGGIVSGRLGRQRGLLLNATLFIVGIVLAALSPTLGIFILARLVMGLAVGNSAVITPMYMAEVSPPDSRGRILFLYQLSIVIGILVSFLIGVAVEAFLPNPDTDWRVMIGFGLVPASLFLLGMLKMPRSPRWLIEKEYHEEAHRVLLRMLDRKEARKTFAEIHEAAGRKTKATLTACFGKLILPVMLLGFFLQFFQQSTGINADMYFGPQIFEQGGFDKSASMWAQVVMGVVNLCATIASIFLVDRLGRRKLMFLGVTGIVAMLCAQSLLFHLDHTERPPKPSETVAVQPVLPNTYVPSGVVQTKPGAPHAPSEITYWIFASILLYIVFFAISAGPLCWLIISEIFPIRFRGMGMSIAVAANWFVDYFVSQLFPIMKEGLGMSFTFLLYAAFTMVGLLLAIRFLPETRGVPLEKIEENIYAGKPLRRIGA